MNIDFTYHARNERINGRLAGLVTESEVVRAIEANPNREYIDVKYFDHRIYLGEPSDPDTPKGDKITACVKWNGNKCKVITVMLRKSTSESERYNR
ncbi:MAG TPA: hypothetical protein VIY48_01920 [Candidatus Paceibacterota bacterium]